MGFAVFFFLAWLVTAFLIVMQKSLSLVENTFIISLILIISINWSWIIYEGLKFIKITEQPMDYTAFLFFRSVIIPIILVIQLNMVLQSESFAQTILIPIVSIGILVALTALSSYFHMTNYVKWNIGYDVLYFAGLHVIAYLSCWLFRKIAYREGGYL
ncbi:hypothetical protein CFK37_17395 [Virgibacillus phasianinus]|uniref:Uncharacterized protein n=1 Tax=Virgibacillus phasianinus TaxID=2017483 RepID=A0A220U6Y4_9BACI|nr:hypothetical protein [Virgibacillus phasianinus]ASK63805.1 hypothetical protein CFK37_17395 [Virgibacillus phasianinus]